MISQTEVEIVPFPTDRMFCLALATLVGARLLIDT